MPLHTSTLIVDLTLRSTLLLTLAWLVCLALHRSSSALRHLIWMLVFLGLVLLPAISLLAPWNLEVPAAFRTVLAQIAPREVPEHSSHRKGAPAARISSSFSDLEKSAVPLPVPRPLSAPNARSTAFRLDRWLAVGWLAGFLAVLGTSLIGLGRIWYLTRCSKPLARGAWPALVAEISSGLDLRAPLRIRMSRIGPLVWGLWRPVLLLPATARSWPTELRRVVLLHELAHVQRADCLVRWRSRLVAAFFWFQPLIWIGLRRLRLEQEKACDDLVLQAGTRASDYAGHLLGLVASLRPAPPLAVAASLLMARRSDLEGRLISILDAPCTRGLSRRIAGITVLCALVLILPLAALQLHEAAGRADGRKSQALPARGSLASVRNAASTLHAPDAKAPFAERWRWGLDAAAPGGAWIGYSFERPMHENEWIGQLGGLGEIVDFANAPDGTETAANSGSVVRKEVAVLLRVPARGKAVDAIRVSNLDLAVDLGGRRLVWLGRAEDGESLLLLEHLENAEDDSELKADLVEAISIHQHSAQVVPFLLSVLGGQDPDEVRAEAASGLGRHESDASRAALIAAIHGDRSSRIQEEAAQGLARQPSPASFSALTQIALDGSPAVRRVATEELGSKPADPALALLIRIANQDLEIEVQRTAVEAIGKLADRSSDETGSDALRSIAREHPAPDVRRQAVESLGTLHRPEGVPASIAALLRIAFDDRDAQVQAQVVETLQQIDGKASTEALRQLADHHPDPELREYAKEALASLADPH